MPLVYPNMQLSEVVEEHPSLIPVINRFGIRLGLGDKSVKTLCEEHSLDTDFLLTVINTFLNEEYFPEKKLQTFHTSQIIDYLTKTNQITSEQRTEDTIEALLADLKSIMVKHLSGDYDENLCYAVLFSICSLEKDIKQHNRIRYRILTPMVSAMEKLCI